MIQFALSLACAFGGPYIAPLIIPLINIPLLISSFLPLYFIVLTNSNFSSVNTTPNGEMDKQQAGKVAFLLYYFMLAFVVFTGARSNC